MHVARHLYNCVVRGTRPRKQTKRAKCLAVASGQNRVPNAGTHRGFSRPTLSECHARSRGNTKRRGSAPPAGTWRFWLLDRMRDWDVTTWVSQARGHCQLDRRRGRCCTNRNGTPTVPTTAASSPDSVRSWAAHGGHRIQDVACEQRFDRSPPGGPGSKAIADDRLVPEEGVLDSRLLMVA